MDISGEGIGRISLNDRVLMASRIYYSVMTYFVNWNVISSNNFDDWFESYLNEVIDNDDRYSFDMHTMEFLAKLKSGNTAFVDNWLNKQYNQAMPFELGHFPDCWHVRRSAIRGLPPGSTVEKINGIAFEEFYNSMKKRVSSFGDIESRTKFSESYYLFPNEFVLETSDGPFKIKREKSHYFFPKAIEGYWLERNKTAYIRIRQFSKSIEEDAIDYVKEFFDSKRLIIDVRENTGGTTPLGLIKKLMDNRFGFWRESTPMGIGLMKFYSEFLKNNHDSLPPSVVDKMSLSEIFSNPEMSWGPELIENEKNHYDGDIFIIADRYSRSSAEDFMLPFKESGRATIVGEATMGSNGQAYSYAFKNGMQLFIDIKKEAFPDGSRFQGIGIMPDHGVRQSLDDMRNGVDAPLEFCLGI